VFEQYVEGVQTRIDNQTPPEMRWLVMFPKLDRAPSCPSCASRYAALASLKPWLQQWLEGPLTQALAAAALEPGADGADDRPRPADAAHRAGRARAAGAAAVAAPVRDAMREARRVAERAATRSAPSTQASLWSSSALPGDEREASSAGPALSRPEPAA
jgi:hypothetical protein